MFMGVNSSNINSMSLQVESLYSDFRRCDDSIHMVRNVCGYSNKVIDIRLQSSMLVLIDLQFLKNRLQKLEL